MGPKSVWTHPYILKARLSAIECIFKDNSDMVLMAKPRRLLQGVFQTKKELRQQHGQGLKKLSLKVIPNSSLSPLLVRWEHPNPPST